MRRVSFLIGLFFLACGQTPALHAPANDPKGSIFISGDLWDAPDFHRGYLEFRKNALAGDFVAQITLAKIYFSGRAVFQSKEQGLRWLEFGSRQGNAEASLLLALMYLQGEEIEKNYDRARAYFQRAGEGGKWTAYFGLGRMAENGLGESINLQKAFGYYWFAAQKTRGEVGQKEIENLSRMLSASDIARAKKWSEGLEKK